MSSNADSSFTAVRSLSRVLYEIAKFWWSLVVASRALAVVFGIVGVLFTSWSKAAAFAIVVVSIASELAGIRSDGFRARAELLLRRLDLNDGLGIAPPPQEIADIRAALCNRHLKRADKVGSDAEPYFASDQPSGPRRLAEMMEESAWWTKHLASTMSSVYLIIFVVIIALSVVALVIALQQHVGATAADLVARTAIAIIGFAFSTTIFKQMLSYKTLSEGAAKSEAAAARVVSRDDALAVAADYQLRRAMGPLIPTWVWKRRRIHLNVEWSRRQKRTG